MSTPPVEEQLAWEAEQRPRAVSAAAAAAVLTLAGNLLLAIITRDVPTEDEGFISLPESLGAVVGGTEPRSESLLARQVEYYGDNALGLSISTVLTTVASILSALLLLFLYRATRARNEAVGRLPYYATLAGLILFPVGHLVRELGAWIGASGFGDDGDRSATAAREVFSSGAVGVGSLLEVLGSFALALAFVLVAMNAMRVGLLTRFFGILGILVGALTVFQLDQPQIVRAFWLGGVGLLIAGRLPRGPPPAWSTGRSEPWPTQQQLREARDAAKGNAPAPKAGKARPEPAGAVSAEGEAAPGPQKRKRKKRR